MTQSNVELIPSGYRIGGLEVYNWDGTEETVLDAVLEDGRTVDQYMDDKEEADKRKERIGSILSTTLALTWLVSVAIYMGTGNTNLGLASLLLTVALVVGYYTSPKPESPEWPTPYKP